MKTERKYGTKTTKPTSTVEKIVVITAVMIILSVCQTCP